MMVPRFQRTASEEAIRADRAVVILKSSALVVVAASTGFLAGLIVSRTLAFRILSDRAL